MIIVWQFLTAALLLIGAFLIVIAAYGLYRMPDTFTRMSAATKASTLGAASLLLGAALYFRSVSTIAQVLVTIVFLIATAPVGAHIIARAGYRKRRAPIYRGTVIDELRTYYDEQGQREKVEEA